MKNYEPYLSPTAELYHWGIPLMRWGQQRYQNKDGTWTEEGLRRRREREGGKSRTTVTVTANFKPSNQSQQQPKPYKPATSYKKRSRAEQEAIVDDLLRNMTDADIRAAINRLNIEKEYKDILLPEVQKEGRMTADKIVKLIGDVGTNGVKIVDFAVSLNKLKYAKDHPEVLFGGGGKGGGGDTARNVANAAATIASAAANAMGGNNQGGQNNKKKGNKKK